MRYKGWLDLDDQPLELFVLGIGHQCLVDRVEHGLMIRNLVVDVGLVEILAFQAFELLEVIFAAGHEALAGRVVFRLDLEFLCQRGGLLVDAGMVGDHLLGEGLDVLIGGFRLGELACVDVDLVRRDHYVRDLGVSGSGGSRCGTLCQGATGREKKCTCENNTR